MRALTGFVLSFGLGAGMALAASLPTTQVHGEYVEARTADVYTGPCFANSEGGLTGNLAVMGWKIDKGTWQGVNLDGLSVVGVVRASNTLGDVTAPVYPVKAVLIIDQRANLEQRLALKSFAQRMSGDLLTDLVRVEYQPISLTLAHNSVHTGSATLVAGNLAKIQTRALEDQDQICHNEQVWYQPLAPVSHAMPAYTLANSYEGKGLGTVWNWSGSRGSFVASFQYSD